MKKTIGLLVSLAVMFVPSIVNAAEELPQAVNNVITLTEDVALSKGYVVKSGESITLNLAGFTLETTNDLKADTIYVEKGASLTITGDGTIKVNAKGYAAVFNNGTTIINGATLKRDVTGGNDWYVICNHGIMTIQKANVSVNGTSSSLVENGYSSYNSSNERTGYVAEKNIQNPTLTILDGIFDGGMNTIKNDDNAQLTIKGGTFQNNYQVAVMNWNIATIDGGTYKTPTGNDKTNLFVGSAGADSVNKGILIINDGIFEGEHVLESKTGVTTAVTINGGVFKNTKSFMNEDDKKSTTNFLESGAKIVGEVEAPKSALKYAVVGATVNLTDAKVGDQLEFVNGVTINIPNDKDESLIVIEKEDGTKEVAVAADLTELIKIIDKLENINEDDYTKESIAALLEVIEKGESLIYSKDHQAEIDAYAKELNDAIDNLVLKPSEPDIKNPETGNNIMLYVTSGIISTFGLAILKIKKYI